MNTNVNFSSKSQSKAIFAKKSSILKSLISLFSIKSWWNATARKCCKSFSEIQTNLSSTLLTSLLHWGNNRTPFCPLKIFYLSLDYVYPFLKIMKVIFLYLNRKIDKTRGAKTANSVDISQPTLQEMILKKHRSDFFRQRLKRFWFCFKWLFDWKIFVFFTIDCLLDRPKWWEKPICIVNFIIFLSFKFPIPLKLSVRIFTSGSQSEISFCQKGFVRKSFIVPSIAHLFQSAPLRRKTSQSNCATC